LRRFIKIIGTAKLSFAYVDITDEQTHCDIIIRKDGAS